MYSLELVITIALAAIIVGSFVGFFIAQKTGPSQQSQRLMKDQFKEMQQQQENYQQEVAEHFVETAGLLNQLTSSYRDVHNHLAKGAQILAGDHANEGLETLSNNTAATKPSIPNMDDLMPPLDYAPKSPNQTGMLNEEFGLDKDKPQKEEQDVVLASEDKNVVSS